MKHTFHLDGYGYRLRPIRLSDAQFIIDTRLEDMDRNRFVHTISSDLSVQELWLRNYFEREDDFYFVIENRISGKSEGLISFYDVCDGRAEWGRWVVRKGSLAAPESVYLLYRIAFEQAGLHELYCQTISDNTSVVSFHNSIGEKTRGIHPDKANLNGKRYDVTEQFADKQYFYDSIAPKLEKKSKMIALRNMKQEVGAFEFHHIGVATRSIEKELPVYTLLGYDKEGTFFEDSQQGIRGVFMVANNQARLELLENLEGSCTLDQPLERGNKFYHIAYYVQNIDSAINVFIRNRAKIISPLKQSAYFKKRICFLMLSNMQLIELIEK